MSNTEDLLEERGNQWGDATITHTRIAQVWSGILNVEVSALDVALCMTGLKLVRAQINPSDPDSFDDAHGYVKISELVAGHIESLWSEDETTQWAKANATPAETVNVWTYLEMRPCAEAGEHLAGVRHPFKDCITYNREG